LANSASNYIHTLDTVLIMAADTIFGYGGLLDGKAFKQTAYALDRDSRKAALARFLRPAEAMRPFRISASRPSLYAFGYRWVAST